MILPVTKQLQQNLGAPLYSPQSLGQSLPAHMTDPRVSTEINSLDVTETTDALEDDAVREVTISETEQLKMITHVEFLPELPQLVFLAPAYDTVDWLSCRLS